MERRLLNINIRNAGGGTTRDVTRKCAFDWPVPNQARVEELIKRLFGLSRLVHGVTGANTDDHYRERSGAYSRYHMPSSTG